MVAGVGERLSSILTTTVSWMSSRPAVSFHLRMNKNNECCLLSSRFNRLFGSLPTTRFQKLSAPRQGLV